MSEFDPYHKWLGIPETERPISKYRLLALADFEVDREVISAAAERQTIYLRTLQAGEHAVLVAELLNEVSQARVTLLNADQKAEYDEELRQQQTPEPEAEPTPPPIPVVQTPSPTPVVVRGTVTQEFPVSIVQPAKIPRRKRQKEIWKQPAVIGISVVVAIGVLVLFISQMSPGDADPVASNTADLISVDMAAEKAAMEKAAAEKAEAVTVALDKGDWKAVLSLYPNNSEGLRMKAAADKAAADKAAMDKAALDKAALDKAEMDKAEMDKAAADKAAMEKAAADKAAMEKAALQAAKRKAAVEAKRKAEEAATKKAAEEVLARNPITNTISMKLKLIPAGTFMMGSPESEIGRGRDEDQHKVTISKAFYMQTTEVTQGQWKAVMATEPWKGKFRIKEGPNYAASYVSWNDAVAYCEKLSEKESVTYRLPTEAEWEYACRAETKTTWSFGDDEASLGDYAWHDKNAYDIDVRGAHQVGLKKPNAFGLYDMHGNVYEWCHDYYGVDYYKQSRENDPTGPSSGSSRVLRGGSWYGNSRFTRSASRRWFGARRYDFFGFRLVREWDDSTQSTPPPVPPNAPAIESITNSIGMTLNEIPAGTFMMGSPEDERERGSDEQQHKVTISKAFYMQTTEVTQGQWKAVMQTEPWRGKKSVKEGPNYVSTYVSWDDALGYCKKLSEKEGKIYRLPTEAEWEYACRAGAQTTWSFGDDKSARGDYAWNNWSSTPFSGYAHQVGLKKPNAFGLYDMHGNVTEWCNDYYGRDYYMLLPATDPQGPVLATDPQGPASVIPGTFRILRGGSFMGFPSHTRSASRRKQTAIGRFRTVGFRVVRELD
jgi:formylglycine-generating enzyme required for sulfatase activity